jgi:phage replication-related protein YjqB (UPF0714/DUF867 family)
VFAELLRQPGVEEVMELRSSFGFLAFHGGSLEEETDTIAVAAAARAGASLYAVLQPAELRWHIPSADVDPGASPALARFLDHVEVVVALHGYGRAGWWTKLLAGGGNRALAADVRRRVEAALPGYEVIDDLSAIPRALRGMHPDNPVNRPRCGGVQLELPPRVRGLGPYWNDHPEEARPTAALVTALGSVAQAWVSARDSEPSTSEVRRRSSGVPNGAPMKSVAPPSAMRPI